MKIIVTGAAGFIGSNLVKALNARGVTDILAVDNLIRNAMDATPAGGRIDVSARSARDAHRIVVRDSGPGIPPDVLPRIFDLYFTTKRDGTGVGLAVSQQIVAGHRGRLEVESAPGAGATFTIVLPTTS